MDGLDQIGITRNNTATQATASFGTQTNDKNTRVTSYSSLAPCTVLALTLAHQSHGLPPPRACLCQRDQRGRAAEPEAGLGRGRRCPAAALVRGGASPSGANACRSCRFALRADRVGRRRGGAAAELVHRVEDSKPLEAVVGDGGREDAYGAGAGVRAGVRAGARGVGDGGREACP